MKKMNRPGSEAFTLLEVILSITILSTMMLISTQALTRALRARTKIQAEVDDVSALRDSLRMIRADINLAFHHRDFEKELQDIATKPATPSGTASTPFGGANPATAPRPRQTKRYDPVTNFIGEDGEFNFVTLNSGRLSSAVVQADFVEVGYSIKSCNNLTTQKASKCLFRRVQNIVDEDVKTGGNEIVMLENVSEFKLRYIGETKQDWDTKWDSSPTAIDANTRGRFPDAVEVSLSIEREFEGKEKTYSMQLVVPVHFPNNPAKSPGQASTFGAAGVDPAAGAGGGQIDH